MSSAVSASVTEKTRKQVTPFDEVLAREEREEARVQAVLDELARTEKEAEEGMRDAEATQEEKLRAEAKQALLEERDVLAAQMQAHGKEVEQELDTLEAAARTRAPALVRELTETVLSPDFFTTA